MAADGLKPGGYKKPGKGGALATVPSGGGGGAAVKHKDNKKPGSSNRKDKQYKGEPEGLHRFKRTGASEKGNMSDPDRKTRSHNETSRPKRDG